MLNKLLAPLLSSLRRTCEQDITPYMFFSSLIKTVKLILIILAILWSITSSFDSADLIFARLVATISLLTISFSTLSS